MDWINALIQGILLGGSYALLATGLSLVFGVMRLVNLANGDLAVLAAYVALVVVGATGVNPFMALPLVVLILGITGYLLQRVILNRTVERGPLPPLIVTFGLAVVIQNTLLAIFSADSQGLDAGAIENASIGLPGGLAVGVYPFLTLGVAVVTLSSLSLFLARTRVGRALRAASDDQEAATMVGIDNRHLYGVAMGIAMGTVALAGVFLGIRTTFAPADGPVTLIFAFETVVLGGLGSLWGTLAGGVILGVAQAFGNQVNPAFQLLAGHLVFLIVLIARPQGLFPRAGARQS